MELFAEALNIWLKRRTGIISFPSQDTFNQIFQAIKPEHCAEFLARATDRIRKNISGEIVAFDGMTHHGTGECQDSAFHMLNVWAVKNRIVLGQLPVPDKSNEIPAMPQLMDILDLKDNRNCAPKNFLNLSICWVLHAIALGRIFWNIDKWRKMIYVD